ncbi:MAG: tripartite tricarboxylate transporter substrate binding protein [Betaproteobacteria bacterium]|nr:tripartite tricarboxylate transporter substrate binding protein [Betaproteobacteria bacterium]
MPPNCLRRVAFVVLAGVTTAVSAQAYPTKPIRFLVPFGPGGVGDITARVVAQKMGASLGQQVIIDNRPGAGGIVASEIVAKAAPDGYTLLLLNNAHAVSMSLFKSLPYDTLRDFAPVSSIATFSIVLLVNPDSPIKSVKDLIASARASPGKLNVGTIQIGATQHLSSELFKSMAGIDVVHVPFTNTGAVLTGLRGGSVQVAFEFIAPVVGQVKAGVMRALAVSTRSRFAGLPDVPTVHEAGVPGYEVMSWNGIGAPAGTPKAVVNRLNRAVAAALALPDVTQRFQEMAVDARPDTPEGFRKLVASEIVKWRKVIEGAKIPKQ